MEKDFFDSLLDDIEMIAAIESSKDDEGHVDPYVAAGMLYGMKGDLSLSDLSDLGTFLGAEDTFDDQDGDF